MCRRLNDNGIAYIPDQSFNSQSAMLLLDLSHNLLEVLPCVLVCLCGRACVCVCVVVLAVTYSGLAQNNVWVFALG